MKKIWKTIGTVILGNIIAIAIAGIIYLIVNWFSDPPYYFDEDEDDDYDDDLYLDDLDDLFEEED